MKKKILLIAGTRPEAIKLAPVYSELRKSESFEPSICLTGQHDEMIKQVLNVFNIVPDFKLNFEKGRNLSDLTADLVRGLGSIFTEIKPDLTLVHGDTTTSFTGALASFYNEIKIGHIEAGLRTFDIRSPFPEEANRRLVSVLADYHFSPTKMARDNLLAEGVCVDRIFVTGNTVIDALLTAKGELEKYPEIPKKFPMIASQEPFILVTGHRRESFGQGFERICKALKIIAQLRPELKLIYPVHLNPQVKDVVHQKLSGLKNVFLIEPQGYLEFVFLMSRSTLVLTDSGGIQEEAPALDKPVLVMREISERQEAIDAGGVKLVGTSVDNIVSETCELIDNSVKYKLMSNAVNPYGSGDAGNKIVDCLVEEFFGND